MLIERTSSFFSGGGNPILPPNSGAQVQTYALNISNSPYLRLANLTFLGCTIHAAGNISHLALESLAFNYPSFSRRMLGELHSPANTVISAVATAAPAPGPPAPPGPSPVSPKCTAAVDKVCPGLAGGGAKCETCVEGDPLCKRPAYAVTAVTLSTRCVR